MTPPARASPSAPGRIPASTPIRSWSATPAAAGPRGPRPCRPVTRPASSATLECSHGCHASGTASQSPSGSQAGILETLAGTDSVSLVTTDALLISAAACASASVCADYFGRKTSGASTSTSYLAYLTAESGRPSRHHWSTELPTSRCWSIACPTTACVAAGQWTGSGKPTFGIATYQADTWLPSTAPAVAGTSPSGVIGLACPADDACVVATEPDSAHQQPSAQPAQTVRGHQEAGAVALRRMVVRSGRAHSHPDHRPAVDAVPTRCGLGRRCEVDRRGPRRPGDRWRASCLPTTTNASPTARLPPAAANSLRSPPNASARGRRSLAGSQRPDSSVLASPSSSWRWSSTLARSKRRTTASW